MVTLNQVRKTIETMDRSVTRTISYSDGTVGVSAANESVVPDVTNFLNRMFEPDFSDIEIPDETIAFYIDALYPIHSGEIFPETNGLY